MSAAPVTASRRLVISRVARVGRVEQRLVERRCTGQHGDPLSLHELEHGGGLEYRDGKDRRAAHQRGEAAGLVAEDVEERVHDQITVARAQVGPVAPVEVRAQRLTVRHHDTLGTARGSRREHDVAWVVGSDRRDAGVELVLAHRRAAREKFGPVGASARVAGQHDGVLQRGERHAGRAQQRGVVGVEEPAYCEQRARLAAREHVRGLGALEAGVDRNEHAAGRGDAQGGNDPFERVGCPHRDTLAGLDARCDQRTRRVAGHRGQLDEADAPRTADDRVARGIALSGVPNHGGDRRPGHLATHARIPPSTLAAGYDESSRYQGRKVHFQ